MTHNTTQKHNRSYSFQPSEQGPKKWYHLTLFRKFALIFLGGVAIPMIALVFYLSYQSKVAILESTVNLTSDVSTSMYAINQLHKNETESAFILTNRAMTKLGIESLNNLKERLIEDNVQFYTHEAQQFMTEFQALLEQEFQTLNHEIAWKVSDMLDCFVRQSRDPLSAIANSPELVETYNTRITVFRRLLEERERFSRLQFFNETGRSSTQMIRRDGKIQIGQLETQSLKPYVSAALSGNEQVIPSTLDNEQQGLHIFLPVKKEETVVGVLFGEVEFRLLWEDISAQFFRHGEQIFMVDEGDEPLYPQQVDAATAADLVNYMQALHSTSEAEGSIRHRDTLVSSQPTSRFGWTVLVVQAASSLQRKLAPSQERVAQYIAQLKERLQTVTEEEVEQITLRIAEAMEQRRNEAREHISKRNEAFLPMLQLQVNSSVEYLADTVHRKTLYNVIPITLGTAIIAILIGMFIARRIIKPIKRLTAIAHEISLGNVGQVVPDIRSHDEIGQLARSFQHTIDYLQDIAKGARDIAEGEFSGEITPVSPKDQLGVAFKQMTHYLQEIAGLACDISRGDLSQSVTPKSEADILGNAVYRMTVYLQRIAHVAKKIAGGNLSEQPQAQSENDFLGQAFAEMLVRLRHLVSKIRTDSTQLVTMSLETQSRAQEEAESVEKILLSVEETSGSMNEMAASIGEVSESMKHLSSYVGESSSSIEEMNSSIRQIVGHCEQLSNASQETSSSIQEITASLQQISDTAQLSKTLSDGATQDAIHGREAVEKMIRSMKSIEHMVTVTAEAIRLLNKRTESIETILDVIKDISDQTSLLSINASIIAKKAGERGRGFNVIADKVRKLADQSNLSAKEIARIIRDVRKESAHAVEVAAMGHDKVRDGVTLAELAGKALDKIITGANESSSVVTKIAETTTEQTKISHHIMHSMEEVVNMATQIKYATNEQEQSSAYLMKQVEQVLLLSQQVRQSTQEQTEVVKHVSLAMEDIRALIQMTSERAKESTQSASLLSEHADALKQLVSQFTI